MPQPNDLPPDIARSEASKAAKDLALMDRIQATLNQLERASLQLKDRERADLLAACRESARMAFERTVVYLADLDGPTAQAIAAFLERYDEEVRKRQDAQKAPPHEQG